MSRSDLLIQLVQSGSNGDKHLFKKVVEAIIAEEKAKQHNHLAEKLQESLSQLSLAPEAKKLLLNGNNGRMDTGSNYLFEIRPEIVLNDLILHSDTRNLILSFIEEQQRADLLRSFSLEPRNRMLLMGPPGNGKTSVAEAIASALSLPLLTVRYENIITSYLGETAQRLKGLFEYVRTQHCVLFFDEFDAIGKERGDYHETGEIKRVVSSHLLQIDKLPSYVVAIAATNHSELLDKAVWRRFQVKTILPKPSTKEIVAFLNSYQQTNKISFGISSASLALKLKGMSFSELKDCCDDIMRKHILSLPNTPTTIKRITLQVISNINKYSKI